MPPTHESCVQALLSLQSAATAHAAQPLMAECWQTPPTQASVVQTLLSLQSAAVLQTAQPMMGAWPQIPFVQVSVVHTFPSSGHAAPSLPGVWLHWLRTQASTVHGSLSSQLPQSLRH